MSDLLQRIDERIAQYEAAQADARGAVKMIEGHIAEFQKDMDGFKKRDRQIARELAKLRKYRKLEVVASSLRVEIQNRSVKSEGRKDAPAAV